MTNRIKLRALQQEDIYSLFEIYSDKEAMKYRGSKPMKTIEDAKVYVQHSDVQEGPIRTVRAGVELIETKALIGSVMYRFDENRKNECEIGYSIGRRFWGQGLGREIVQEILQSIEEEKTVHDIVAWSNKKNIASIKILEKSGFQRIAQAEQQNNYLYRKTKSKLK